MLTTSRIMLHRRLSIKSKRCPAFAPADFAGWFIPNGRLRLAMVTMPQNPSISMNGPRRGRDRAALFLEYPAYLVLNRPCWAPAISNKRPADGRSDRMG